MLKGLDKTSSWLKKERQASEKAMKTGVKVEGFRLKNLMQKEIRQGAPGGKRFAPLSYIARRMQRRVHGEGGVGVRQSPNRKPLVRMALAVRYAVLAHPFAVKVGFVSYGGSVNQVSSTWRKLAARVQKGFSRNISPGLRRMIVRRGEELGTADGGATPFFLRKNTHRFDTPARPIVSPFWQAHARAARNNINRNFRAKLAGKRI